MLNSDISRCVNKECGLRTTCKRFLQVKLDQEALEEMPLGYFHINPTKNEKGVLTCRLHIEYDDGA